VTARQLGPPALGPIAPLRVPSVQHHVLECGLEVLLVERPELPVLDARLVVRNGAAVDLPDRAGQAFLTASLLDQGTDSRDAGRIAEDVELLGAGLRTYAAWDDTSVSLHVLTPRLRPALDLLADVILHPNFPADELERQRSERLAAILQERDNPRTLAARTFAATVYGEAHAYGTAIGGTRQTIERITAADVRGFHSRRFRPDNAFLAVAGSVDDTLLPALERSFAAWSAAPPPPAVSTENVMTLPPTPRAIHIVDRPGASQSELRVGHAGPPRSAAEYFPLLVGNTVLGGTFSSRLNMLLREQKGYTYGAGSSYAFRAGGGPFVASTAVFTSATADAVADIVREIDRLTREPVPERELERAKNYLTLGLPRSFETTRDIVEQVSEAALHGLGRDYHARYAGAVAAVTASNVQEAAARWLRPEELMIVIVGDAAAVVADLEKLQIGAVHVRTIE
jgi:zinc protease